MKYSGMFISGINGGACAWAMAHRDWGAAIMNAIFSAAVFMIARRAS